MDNLTHSLVGALIGQTGLKRRTGLAMPALIIGANLPDVDAGCVVYGVESLAMRRGITHGPIALILLPIVLAAILWAFDRWQTRRGSRPEGRLPVRFGWLCILAFVACLSHPALDWLNTYGIRLLEPFSSRWFYGDVLFIIDIWLWIAMGGALWLSLRRERRGMPGWHRPALAGLAIALLYVNANLVISRNAAAASADRNAIASPVPVKFWARDLIVDVDGALYRGKGLQRWTMFGGLSDDVTLLTPRPSCLHPLLLPQFAPDDKALQAFLFWSRVPIIRPLEENGQHIARLMDARYAGGAVASSFQVDVAVPAEAENCLPE